MVRECRDVSEREMKRVANHTVKEADGCHNGIPVRVEDYRLQRNVYGGIEWSNGSESVICRRVDGQWQALTVHNGNTRTLLPGLGSQNHVLWLAREYLEFGQTYDGMDVWEELPSRERSNPFHDMLSSKRSSFRV